MKGKGLKGVVLVSCVIALALAGCATDRISPAQEAMAHYKMGISRMESGNDDAALYEFNKAIEKNPDDINTHFAVGYICIKQSKFDGAIKEFKKVLSLDPNFPDAHNNLGLAYVKKKQYEAAIKEFKAASDFPLANSRGDALVNMGETYDLMGNTEQAAQAYREALLAQPDDDMAMGALASVYVKMNKPEEAIKFYEKSLQIKPGNAGAHFALGKIYFTLGKHPEALVNFQKVMELAPGTAMATESEKYIGLLK